MSSAWSAINPFLWGHAQAPYRANWINPPLVVMPATSKTGIGTPRGGTLAHRISAMAVVFVNNKARYGARWRCGFRSPDVILLADEASHDGPVCYQCDPEEPCVYRCRNGAGDLLYIGSTIKRRQRMAAHARASGHGSTWWPEVASIAYEDFPTAEDAILAERFAIRRENPLHNKTGRQR